MQLQRAAEGRPTIASGHVMQQPETHEIGEDRYREWQDQRELVARSLAADRDWDVYPVRGRGRWQCRHCRHYNDDSDSHCYWCGHKR